MPPKPRKIAQHEWDRHKDAIKALYADNKLPEVVERMKQECDFSASKSQYEAQLKLWGIRKNMTRREWEAKLLHTQGRMPSSLTTSSGRVKDRKKIQRAKRYINQNPTIGSAPSTRPPPATTSTASLATLERGPRPDIIGQQHCTSEPPSVPASVDPFSESFLVQGNVNTLPNMQISIGSRSPNRLQGASGWSIEGETSGLPSMTAVQRLASPRPASQEFSFNTIANSQLTTSQLQSDSWCPHIDDDLDLDWFNVDDRSPGFSHSWASNTSILSHPGSSFDTGLAFQNSSATNLGWTSTVREISIGFRNDWFQNLPSTKFEAFLSAQGTALTSKSNNASKPFLSGGLALMSVFSILSKSSDTSTTGHFKDAKAAFLRLSDFIPSTTGAVISEQQMTDTKILKMIFFSMINGFFGMDGIPIESLLSCLRRLEMFKTSFEQLLLGPPSPAKRSFIDNLFKAAIAAEDEEMVKMIIKHDLVDVDNTVCFTWDRRYTPVERAASLKALGIIRILVEYGADVNKSHPDLRRFISWSGALEHLLESCHSESPAQPLEFVNTVRLLIARGAKIRIESLNQMLDRVGIDEVGSLLSHALPPADHRAFFDKPDSVRFPKGVIKAAGLEHDGISNSIIKSMVGICLQSHDGSCLSKSADVIEDTAVVAAIRGRVETVKLLIGFAASTGRIVSAAIRSRDPDLIQFLFDRSIDFNPPAGSCLVLKGDYPTTPFAEAIRTGNSEMIGFLESKGCGTFSSLTDHGRLEAAIFAAVEGANIDYLRKFLSIASHSKVKFRIPSSVVRLAVDRRHEEVTQFLVEQGAELGVQVLKAALEQRDQKLLAVVLATDITWPLWINDDCTQLLLKWAEPSVLQSILYMMPDIDIRGQGPRDSKLADFCSHCMDADNLDLFRFFIESTSYPDKDLNGCLAMAVRVGHRRMASYLLKKGANPSNSSVLAAAIHDRPEMLPWLLGNTTLDEERAHSFQKCIGANILWSWTTEDTKSVEASVLDKLLEIGAVNFIVPEMIEFQLWVTPLGLAILDKLPFRSPNFTAVNKLLEAGADPNGLVKFEISPNRCITALMAAVGTGRKDMVTLLIAQKADVNLKPRLSLRRTPLQYAAELGNLDMIQLLLQKGADVNGHPAYQGGGTALQFAAISGNCNNLMALLDQGARMDIPPSKFDGRWPLEGAAEHGRLDMIQLLWSARELSPGNAGFEKRQCLRAMDFARENGHCGCRDLIAELSGLSVEMLDTEDYGVPWLA